MTEPKDRMTFDGNFCDIAQCREERWGKYCPDGACSQRKVWERLKEYEDAADVAPVRHGRWERVGIKGRKELPIYPCCSACGRVSAAYRSEWEGLRGPWKYCPNCGARMGGAE